MEATARWSWRWMFDGDPPGALRRWLFALVIAAFGIAGVVVTGARQAASLAVVAIFLGQVVWQPFVSVARIDRARGRPEAKQPARVSATPLRPRAWYRALLAVAALWIVLEVAIAVAVTRIPERRFWWFLALGGAILMVVAGIVSALATWRVQRAAAAEGPAAEPQQT